MSAVDGREADLRALHATIAAATDPVPCAGRDDWLTDDPDQLAAAATACSWCAVLATCHAYATRWAEPAGVWGGTTPGDRGHQMPRAAAKPEQSRPAAGQRSTICLTCSTTFRAAATGALSERCPGCREAHRRAMVATRSARARARRREQAGAAR